MKSIPPYPAKILLFGEYTIISGSAALAMPLPLFGGQWAFEQDKNLLLKKQQQLPALLQYLQGLQVSENLLANLDLQKFSEELSEGIYFDSSIPTGYGAGSSGALCAAIYERYLLGNPEKDWTILKNNLAQIESFFHGSSSGIDPLVAFVQQPIQILSNGNLQPMKLPPMTENAPHFFLVDTGISRKTEPLVQLFQQKCREADFRKKGLQPLLAANDAIINHFLAGRWQEVIPQFQRISRLQLTYFSEMIPEDFRAYWQAGLRTKKYFWKLCGAGGGGFILGMTYDLKGLAESELVSLDLVEILAPD